MRRRVIAAAWVLGATVPLLMTALFVFGCCVLPFHGVMHKLMPICQMAVSVIQGGHAADGHDHGTVPPPSREKQEPVQRIVTTMTGTYRLAVDGATTHAATPTASTAYRSFISLGAIRCDRDVGLHVLGDTFRI